VARESAAIQVFGTTAEINTSSVSGTNFIFLLKKHVRGITRRTTLPSGTT
jgi:hypothetical protein